MNITVLGFGYTGRFFLDTYQTDTEWVTSRREQTESKSLVFDLMNPSTWGALPPTDGLIWTFPPAPLDMVQDFYESHLKKRYTKMVVIGSTSAFDSPDMDLIEVDETSPLRADSERVESEEYLRDQGFVVVRASGIYGPGRSPLKWLKEGRIKNIDKYVNLIHVQDLVHILHRALLKGHPGSQYIASDGFPYLWRKVLAGLNSPDLNEIYAEQLAHPKEPTGKLIKPKTTPKALGYETRFALMDFLKKERA